MDDYDVQNYLLNYEGKFAELSEDIDFDQFALLQSNECDLSRRRYAVPFDSGSADSTTQRLFKWSGDRWKWTHQSNLVQICGDWWDSQRTKWFVAFIPNRGTHYIQMAMQSAGLWYFDEDGNIFLKDNPAIREMLPILKTIEEKLAKPVDYLRQKGSVQWRVEKWQQSIQPSGFLRQSDPQKIKKENGLYNLPQLETVSGAHLHELGWF